METKEEASKINKAFEESLILPGERNTDSPYGKGPSKTKLPKYTNKDFEIMELRLKLDRVNKLLSFHETFPMSVEDMAQGIKGTIKGE